MISTCYNQLILSFEESSANTFEDLEKYKRETLAFCDEWFSGQENFQIHTSGSTGKPKPITITRKQMVSSAKQTGSVLGLEEGDKALVCLNTKYIAGKMMLVRGFEIGMKMTVCTPVANPLKRFDESFDFIALVPYQFQTIMEETPEKAFILNNMKAIILGGAPITKPVEELAKKVSAPVYSTYGMTETVSHIALRRINGPEASSAYTVIPGVEIDLDNRSCLKIKGDITQNEWIVTNDVVKLNLKDEFIWVGRVDNVINSGGIKIQIEELEKEVGRVFLGLGLTNRFIITSIPDSEFGSVAVLVVEGKIGKFRQTQILKKLGMRVSKYELPKKVVEVVAFEETATGKIDRISTKALIL